MAKKMLIDASHPEETRVVVVEGNRVEEFDFESINKKQLAGNIYLAKVMRVEPSLQAAFVDYGGNRHGFLAFSEIHPDYYQIPKADREALLAEEEAAAAAANQDDDDRPSKATNGNSRGSRRAEGGQRNARRGGRGGGNSRRSEKRGGQRRTRAGDIIEREFRISGGVRVRLTRPDDGKDPSISEDGSIIERSFRISGGVKVKLLKPAPDAAPVESAAVEEAAPEQPETPDVMAMATDHDHVLEDGENVEAATAALQDEDEDDDAPREMPEDIGGDDVEEERSRPPRQRMRNYKIQEVIKKRQIMLVQVAKEERGNKGAAVTTYLSLAGRYCVLMPNTARGGGISRKITVAADRKKLKEIASELEVPRGTGLIIRTAGAQRTRAEIKRDYEYLLRQWESVRELTMRSIAPTLIYEEGSLIKRSIRDLYAKEIESVHVEGEDGYREAKDYMKLLMPSHAKNVQPYRETAPLFIKNQVESQLAAMFNPVVQLRSGGYIVIGITEALVAVDVNSGRSTKERSIEDTALKTNLEAADEVARQMRLRDLAGLLVIDFIDMDDNRNNRAVEKRMKERCASDRARLQIGKISAFGLMEMSRQRLRPGMLEATTQPCAHCHGSGIVRSDDTMALTILREIEEEGMKQRTGAVLVKAPVPVANFILNHKRERLFSVEKRYDMRVILEGDAALISPDFSIEKTKLDEEAMALRRDQGTTIDVPLPAVEADPEPEAQSDDGEERGQRRGRRGGKRRRNDEDDAMRVIDLDEEKSAEPVGFASSDSDGEKRNGQRRSKRGGRGRGRGERKEFAKTAAESMMDGPDALTAALPDVFVQEDVEAPAVEEVAAAVEPAIDEAQAAPSEPLVEEAAAEDVVAQEDQAPAPSEEPEAAEVIAAPEPEVVEIAAEAEPEPEPIVEPEPALPPKPKKRGWWSRNS